MPTRTALTRLRQDYNHDYHYYHSVLTATPTSTAPTLLPLSPFIATFQDAHSFDRCFSVCLEKKVVGGRKTNAIVLFIFCCVFLLDGAQNSEL
jgi:hypothetical protein